ncbi:hypothetical protein DesfrDRAFT_2175 [Solidesulfovibrio fructosivorans JJ]]|uniref:Uncharacterized protein n=1 Tax=Solidesulfovibrio fructosivorans JJ] TaxID=596151 RepID=E1JX51_SOLFR|nr:hypothetical protein DesfrDRAFT_2175 [Solidesulfovibrio fructosivorans JJ]]
MHKRVMIAYDIVVLAGFSAYMALTVWRLPEELRQRLLTASLGVLTHLTGLPG